MLFIRQNIREARALYRSNALSIAPQSQVRELQRRLNTLTDTEKYQRLKKDKLEKIIPAPAILLIQ